MKAAVTLALAFAILAIEHPVVGQGGPNAPHWLGTWFASSTVRVDQPAAPAQSVPSNSNGQALEIPPAVLAVAPSQTLVVGAQSPLRFNNQTLRQIVHITVGGSRLRVVLSNTFGTVPLTIGAAQVALRDRDAAIMPRSNRRKPPNRSHPIPGHLKPLSVWSARPKALCAIAREH